MLLSVLCLTSITPNLVMCSIKKLQIEWCCSFFNQALRDSTRFIIILFHLFLEIFDMAQCSGFFFSTHVANASLSFRILTSEYYIQFPTLHRDFIKPFEHIFLSLTPFYVRFTIKATKVLPQMMITIDMVVCSKYFKHAT